MTTFYQATINHLESFGLFKSQAEKIVRPLTADPDFMAGLFDRWHANVEDYPPNLANMLFSATHPHVIIWIDANLPRHWARPMFLPVDELIQTLCDAGRDDLVKLLENKDPIIDIIGSPVKE